MNREYIITQRVGDRDKVNYSFKTHAFTIPANPMSDRGQMVIEYKYIDDGEHTTTETTAQ